MKISHESPKQLLEASRTYNDYDYALVHMFEQDLDYFNFFKASVEQGREVILDNSIFELGEAFDMYAFAKWIQALKPTYYIIPDVLDDAAGTISNLHTWFDKHYAVTDICKSIGVVQGSNYDEMVACYQELDKFVDKIAISFNSNWFKRSDMDDEHAWMQGRRNLLERLDREGVINKYKPHHLLGVALPQEVSFYRSMSWIESVDTSNPVVHGIRRIRYADDGLQHKESVKLVDLYNANLDEDQLQDIYFNIKKFREFI